MYLELGWGEEVPVLQVQESGLLEGRRWFCCPEKGRSGEGCVSLAPNATGLGQGDLNSAFNMAITQLMTLGKSFFPFFPSWPVIHRIRRLGQRALKPHPVLILSKPCCPLTRTVSSWSPKPNLKAARCLSLPLSRK